MKYQLLRLTSLVALFSFLTSVTFYSATQQALYAQTAPSEFTSAELTGTVLGEKKGETSAGRYIIQLADAPLASYTGGNGPLKATSPDTTGSRKLDLRSPASVSYRGHLAQKRNTVVAEVQKITASKVKLDYVYDVAYNGFALTLTPKQAARVAALPGVSKVQRDFIRYPQTDAGPQWIKADQIWNGTATEIYVATITGANEFPVNGSTARGTSSLSYNDATNTFSYDITITGMTPNNAHIHRGAAGTNGGVMVNLTNPTPGRYVGSTVLAPADETLLRNAGLYLNFHSVAFPGGEIRGQITGVKGEGMLVGVIDTGINMDHPSFAATGADNYTHVNPLGAGTYVGFCNPSNPNFNVQYVCNSKLIGVWGYPDTSNNPEDDDGHGSHTASTAAGNVINSVALNGVSVGTISGVAPHANIIAYDTCNTGAGCPGAALVAAINQATADGVDVINYSIGSGPDDPWTGADNDAFLNARAAGVFAAVSAGNSGPGAGTVGSPAIAPWVMAVGASTHNRAFRNGLLNMSGGATPAPANLPGQGMTQGFGPAPIVFAGDYPNPNAPAGENPALCGAPYPAGTFNGQIVVCIRGIYGRVEKGQNVKAGGAGGYVLVNDAASGNSLVGDAHVLPGVHLTFAQGQTLLAWLDTGSGHTARIQGAVKDLSPSNGDVMASFSSRGENAAVANVLKPDVTAPGVDIVAAVNTATGIPTPEYGIISGTSMASPHAAGAATLLRALHPSWTPAQVQSALMTTGIRAGVRKEDGVTAADPFDVGGGRIDVSLATKAGLLFNETTANYQDANPGDGGDPGTLNIASLANNNCLSTCSWTRTVSSTLGVPSTWTATSVVENGLQITVTPASFTLPAYGTRTFTVQANTVGSTAFNEWSFAHITLTESNNQAPAATMPLAVVPTSGVLPESIDITTRRNAGSIVSPEIRSVAATDIVARSYGLVRATRTGIELEGDSDNSSPYDDLTDGVYTRTLTVPAGAKRLIAEIVESDAPDADLFVILDDGDGIATSEEEVCTSTTATAEEYCELTNPAAGTYIVVVQNWEASATPPDNITLLTAVVPGTSNNNMTITDPGAVAADSPYTIRVFWNLPSAAAGDRWYGAVDLGTAPGSEGNIGIIPVNLVRAPDDVVKTVSSPTILAGQPATLTYTITVAPNTLPENLTYVLSDTIPAGMTYVPGSVTGGATVTGNQLNWTGTMPGTDNLDPNYVQTTNTTDPACDTGFGDGSYIDLSALGIGLSTFGGNEAGANAFTSGAPHSYFNVNSQGLQLYTNGFLRGINTDPIATFGPNNTPIPDPSAPNNVIAPFWDDLEIIIDAATGRGVRLATAGTDAAGTTVVEFDQVQRAGQAADRYTFEVVMKRSVNNAPGVPEIVFAYQTMNGPTNSATVGVENADGTVGAQYAFNGTGGPITNGLMVCYDYQTPSAAPVVITYQVTVANPQVGTNYTNRVGHTTNNPGSMPVVTSVTVVVESNQRLIYLPLVFKN